MANEKYLNKYRIETSRARWHDYNGGAYFITICTQNRIHYFGEIANGIMNLSEIGKYTQKCIENIPTHNPYAEIPLYTVMPDHIHMIILINCTDAPRHVSDNYNNNTDVPGRVSTDLADGKNEKMQNIANKQSKLSATIAGFKQSITRFSRQNNLNFAWQRLYHDHIIRDTNEMNRIATYIENNVTEWYLKNKN